MVGTVSLGKPDDPNATCARCTIEQCLEQYGNDCGDPSVSDNDVVADCDSADVVDGDSCIAAVDCQELIVGEENHFLQYDLSQICSGTGYRFVDSTNNRYYSVNICGYTADQCFPADCANDNPRVRHWENCPCTPWNATANIGSVIRFDNTNLQDPPDAGVQCAPYGTQKECYSDDGVATPCTPSCQVLSATTTDNGGLTDISFINPESPADGLILTYPGVLVSTDPASPNYQACEPASGFDSGVSIVTVHLECDSSMKVNEARIETVSPFGCNYQVQMKTGAVCKATCPPGFGVCGSGKTKGYCSSACAGGGDATALTIFLIAFLGFFSYCALGAGYNKYKRDAWTMPHEHFWMNCLRCNCLKTQGSDNYNTMRTAQGSNSSVDFRTPKYGTSYGATQ